MCQIMEKADIVFMHEVRIPVNTKPKVLLCHITQEMESLVVPLVQTSEHSSKRQICLVTSLHLKRKSQKNLSSVQTSDILYK